ncbi:hypothetical protein RSAG8_12686, partial [Rhizoctonia solani AG-8 WAC10335]
MQARDPNNVLAKPAPQIVTEVSSTDAGAPKDASNTGAASAGAANCLKYDAAHLEALEALDSDREPEFRTINVLAHPRNCDAILDLAHTHMFNPLCAFTSENQDAPIVPAQYGTVLPGAVVRISFTLSHHLMRRPVNVSHFTATINEVEVLHRPVAISMTPGKVMKNKMFLKCQRNDEPVAAHDLRKCACN